jgi:hypothetical protein
LDPELVFKLLVVAEGRIPTFSAKHVDPNTGPITLELKPHDLDQRDPALVFRGRVVDEAGRPLASGVVTPKGFRKGGEGHGDLRGIDALAVTNTQGEFRLGVSERGLALYFHVDARGMAPRNFQPLLVGPQTHELKLVSGVTIVGKVLQEDKPVAGVVVGLVQQDRSGGDFIGDFKISTDPQGVFTFRNVPPSESYYIYGIMDSCRSHGAIAIQPVRVRASGTIKEIGTLTMGLGHRLSGRVILADGKPVPPGTRVSLGRDAAWDSQIATVAEDGTFTFTGLPAERCRLGVHVAGYHMSPKNSSYDFLHGGLLGMIKGDKEELHLLLESGPPLRNPGRLSREQALEYRRLKDTPLRGVEANAIDKKGP